jgi:hypothetical protein
METIKFSVVEKFNLTTKVCKENELIKGITGEKMKLLIEPIRKLILEGEKEKADELKKKLPAIIPSGIFKGGRTPDKLDQYSHIICLDLDDIEAEKLIALKEIIAKCSYTFIVFISPSGQGLKIMVKINSGSNYHTDAYKQVLKFYAKLTGEKFDEKTSDINRLMFMSFDPDVYHYPDSDVFPVINPLNTDSPKINSKLIAHGTADESLFDIIYDTALKFTKNKQEYKEGSRNNFVFNLASSCNRYGLPAEELKGRLDWCNLSITELENTIRSGYKNTDQFGTWILPNTSKSIKTVVDPVIKHDAVAIIETTAKSKGAPEAIEKTTSMSPTLPGEVYSLLPEFLKGITSHFSDGIEKDLVLLSSLGVISSALPKIRGSYARSSKALNLFVLEVAPPSSGKSNMKWAEKLGGGIDKFLQDEYKNAYREYMKPKEDGDSDEPLEKKFFIGANSSSIALSAQMYQNKNIGVMYDSEGGTLAQMFKNDWSNCLNILLKAFENESLSINRKSKTESFNIEKCFLALVLSTTPSQLVNIIGSIENGLYSRFLIYYFSAEVVWKNQFSSDEDCLEPIFEEAANELLRIYKANEEGPNINIVVSEKQRDEINEYFTHRLKEFHIEYDRELLANVYRTCVMYYKIAMILTAVRAYQQQELLPEKLTIDNRDHRAAFLIVDTLLRHVKIVYETTMQAQTNGIIGKKNMLIESLPDQNFQKMQYLALSSSLGIKKPTAEKWLNDLQKIGKIIRLDHGLYRKAS